MHDIGTTQVIAVLVTALAGFVIGGLWYGPLFSKAWMKASGVPTGNMTTAQTVRLFGTAYVINVIIGFGLVMLIGDHRCAKLIVAAGLVHEAHTIAIDADTVRPAHVKRGLVYFLEV